MVGEVEEMGADLHAGSLQIYSQTSQSGDIHSIQRAKDERDIDQIVNQFRVISQAEIEQLLAQETTRVTQQPPNQQFNDEDRDSRSGTDQEAAVQTLVGKKRTYEEVASAKLEINSIDDVLGLIKQRVLMGETLNSFKKEINQLVEIIEERDPKLQRLTD